jgi:hypothetical protein
MAPMNLVEQIRALCTAGWCIHDFTTGTLGRRRRKSHYYGTLYILYGKSLMKYTEWRQNDFTTGAGALPAAGLLCAFCGDARRA